VRARSLRIFCRRLSAPKVSGPRSLVQPGRARTGGKAALLEFRSGVEEVFDVQVLPGLRCPLLSGPFAGQDGGEVIWTVPLPTQGGFT
jgi:hypothetical protein